MKLPMPELLREEIYKCNRCPFLEYKYNAKKELGFGEKYKIMFIGICPSPARNQTNGISSFNTYFNKLLLKVEITKEDYYFTNLCKTTIPQGVLLTDEQEQHCINHLRKEIEIVQPQIIVLLGRPVRKAFRINYPDSVVMKSLKSNDKIRKLPVYSIKHPGYLKYKPEEEEKYLKGLKKIYKFYKQQLF